MSLNLKDTLFESDINKIHASLLKEESKGREIEGNIQTLSRPTLEMVSKFIAQKIDSVKPPEDKIDKETLKKPLGIIDFQVLKKLSNTMIKGMKISPAQIKGEQIPALNTIDFKAYEKLQVIPLFITNKELENVGGSKTGEEFAAVFYLPALYSAIRKENVPLHRQMFGVEEPKKGTSLVHTAINKLHYEMVSPDEVEKIQKSFMTGNVIPITSIERVQSKRIPTGANEKPGSLKDQESSDGNYQENSQEKDEKKVEETFKRYEDILLENSERLLEAPAFWEKIKAKFGEKKGEDTDYTFFSEEEIEDSRKIVTQEAGDNKHVYLAKNLGLNQKLEKHIKHVKVRNYYLTEEYEDFKEIDSVEFVKSFKGNFNRLLNNENLIDLNLFNKEIMSKPFSLKFNSIANNSPFYINLSIDRDKTVKITSNFFSKTISVTDSFKGDNNNTAIYFYIKLDSSSTYRFSLDKYSMNSRVSVSHLNSRFGNEYKKTIADIVNKVNNEIKNETFFGKEINDNIKKSATQYNALKKAIAAFCCAAIKELYYNVSPDFVTSNIIRLIRSKLEKVNLSDLMSTTLGQDQSGTGFTENESDRYVVKFMSQFRKSDFKKIFSKDVVDKVIKEFSENGDDEEKNLASLKANKNFFVDIRKLELGSGIKEEFVDIKSVSSYLHEFCVSLEEIENLNSHSVDVRIMLNALNTLSSVLEKLGVGEVLYAKILEILKLVNRKKNKLDLFELSFDLSGDIAYDEVKKENSPKTKTGLYKSIIESIDNELESISIITNKKLNHKDKDLPFGEELVRRIKSYLAKDSVENKTRKINLDDYLTKSLEGSSIDSLVNYNKVIERMKKDSGDLKVLVEKFDDDDFEKHVESELARTLAKSLAGLLGKNSSLLDHKVNNKNLINEAVSTYIQASAFVTMLGGVASGVLGSPVLAAGLAAGAATLGAISMYVKIKEIAAKRKDYAKNPDLFANDVIENAKKVVLQCLKGMIISVHIDALLKHESELKAAGITLVHESAEMQNIYSTLKKESEKKELKKNLNELGQTIYSEIIDNAYKFKQNTVIGKYINQSAIEKMLINSIFGDANNPRNKFSSLINNLQKEGIALKGNQRFIFECGLKFLLEATEDDKKSKGRKATYEINKLRLQLSEIITEEFNTLNFKSDIMSALEKEFKKQSQKRTKFFSRKKSRAKESLKVFYLAMQKVLGLSKKEVNNILDMSPEELKQLVGESFNKDFAETILENKRLSLLLEKDYYLYGSKVGDEVFLKYQTDAKGVSNPLRVVKGKIAANGKIDPDSIQLVPETDMPASNPAHNLSKSDAQGFIDQMNTKYSGANVSGGFKGGGLDIKIEKFEGPPIEGKGDPEGPPIEGKGDPEDLQVKSSSYNDIMTPEEMIINTLNTVSLIMLSIKLGLMTYIRLDKRVLAGAEISKMLKDVNWAVLPGVAFSEIICRTLLKHKDELKENGVIITGNLASAEKSAVASNRGEIASNVLVNKIKQKVGKKNQKKGDLLEDNEITDSMILDAIDCDIARICKGIIRKYDKDKYEEINDLTKKEMMSKKRAGFMGLGTVIGFFKERSDSDIASKIDVKELQRNKDDALRDATKDDIDSIKQIILSFVKDVKDFQESKFISGKLTNLLFEKQEATNKVNVEDLRQALESSGVLFYSSDLNPEGRRYKQAESYLVGTLASFLKTNFAIEVEGVEQFKALNLKKEAAQESIDNPGAKLGEPASSEISQLTKSAGVPQSLNSPFDINQMTALMNNSGANMMMPFMMMMMMPTMMQQMQQMQQSGATLGEVAEKVKEEAVKSGHKELSELDKDLNEAIKLKRGQLPYITKEEAKKLIKNNKNIKAYFDNKTNNINVNNIKEFFNITDKLQEDTNKTNLDRMTNMMKLICDVFKTDGLTSFPCTTIANYARVFFGYSNKLDQIMSAYSNFYRDYSLEDDSLKIVIKRLIHLTSLETDKKKNFVVLMINEAYNSDFSVGEISADFIKRFYSTLVNMLNIPFSIKGMPESIDDLVEELSADSTQKQIKIMDEKLFKGEIILEESRRIARMDVINESLFLKRELSRLWKV